MTEEQTDISQKIMGLLAGHIGVEESELKKDDSFRDDLHMSAADLTDFAEKLSSAGFEASSLDFSEMETVGDLIEKMISEREIE